MKKLVTTALLGLASAAFIATDARAATLTPGVGDLVLGFRITDNTGQGANMNLEVDLGNIGTNGLLSLAAGQTVSLNALNPTSGGLAVQDLINTYGANWATRTDLAWGLFAASGRGPLTKVTGFPVDTIWANESLQEPGLLPYQSRYRNLQAAGSAQYETMVVPGSAGSIATNPTSTANSTNSVVIDSTLVGSWTQQQDQAITQFNFFNGNPMDATEGTGGTVDSTFYHLTPQSTPNGTAPAQLLGTFALGTDGTFTYTAAPVPEPSSMGLVGVGFLSLIGMVVLRRRRSVVA